MTLLLPMRHTRSIYEAEKSAVQYQNYGRNSEYEIHCEGSENVQVKITEDHLAFKSVLCYTW